MTFGADDRSPVAHRQALSDAVRDALPAVDPPRRDSDWRPARPTYWIDELQLRVVVCWESDRSVHLASGRRPLALENLGTPDGSRE